MSHMGPTKGPSRLELLPATFTGVILAGGESRRFGSNKALAPMHGKPLIQHVADCLTRIFRHCLLIANKQQEYAFLGLPMLADRLPGRGPLAGIEAALGGMTGSYAFITGCDLPFLDERLIRYLCSLAPDYDAVVPRLDNGLEPLYAVYRTTCLPLIALRLAARIDKIGSIFPDLCTRQVTAPEIRSLNIDLATFHNVNRPTDLPA